MNGEKTDVKPPSGSIVSKALRIAAYPISALTGYWVARYEVRDSVYDEVKGKKGEQFRKTYRDEKDALVEKALKAADESQPHRLAGEMAKVNAKYSARIDERLEHLKLNSLFKQWKFIHRGEKQRALMHGFEAGAIMLGALLLVSGSKTLSNAFRRHDKDNENEGPGQG